MARSINHWMMLFALLGVGTGEAAAQTLGFIDSGQALGNGHSADVALGDLDGDGDLDAVIANSVFVDPAENRVWTNQGGAQEGLTGNFVSSSETLGAGNTQSVALGDLDGDGDLDAFLANAGEASRVWINQGLAQAGLIGTFADSGQALGTAQSADVALGDLDGDGDLDALVATLGVGEPDRLWVNQGGAQGGSQGEFMVGQDLGSDRSGAVVIFDADGDGDLDVMTGTLFGDPPSNRLWLNQGGLQAGTQGVLIDSGQTLGDRNTEALATGRLDSDGDMDVLAANGNIASTDRVWVNQGSNQGGMAGQFAPGADLPSDQSLDVALGDVNRDGRLDAFIAKFNDPGLGNEVWINDGAANFTDSGLRLGNSRSRAVALGDLDGDGDLDAFVANDGSTFGGQPNRVWFNTIIDAEAPRADLVLDATPQGSFVREVSSLTDSLTASMTLTLTNNGPDAATDVTLDVQPAHAQAGGPGFTCVETSGVRRCIRPELPSGGQVEANLGVIDFQRKLAGIYAGTVGIFATLRSNEFDPIPAFGSARLSIDFYNCSSACFIETLFCLAQFSKRLKGPSDSGFSVDLPIYYLLRRAMNLGADGRRLVQRYEAHQAEIRQLYDANATIREQSLDVLAAVQPGFAGLVAGRGDEHVVTEAQVDALDTLLTSLSAEGSAALADGIAAERAAFGSLDALVGLSFRAAAELRIPSDVLSVDGFEQPETLGE